MEVTEGMEGCHRGQHEWAWSNQGGLPGGGNEHNWSLMLKMIITNMCQIYTICQALLPKHIKYMNAFIFSQKVSHRFCNYLTLWLETGSEREGTSRSPFKKRQNED